MYGGNGFASSQIYPSMENHYNIHESEWNFLDVADGYVSAVLDQTGKSLTITEKKVTSEEASFKFKIG